MQSYKKLNSVSSLEMTGWLLTSAFVALLAARNLVREGLFGDGLCYAAIARNMALGKGTFWSPFYSTSFWLPSNPHIQAFYEHPPLMFGIQSWFFNMLGDQIWTEKIYAAVLIGLTIYVLTQLWKQLLPANHPLYACSWLPVFIWFTFPRVVWGMTQNFLDTTMSLLCLLAVWAVLAGMTGQRSRDGWLFGILASTALTAAFFTKGPVSLHVLGIPLLYGLIVSRPGSYRTIMQWSVGLTLGFVLLLGLLMLYEPARHNLSMYLHQQLWAALASQRETTGRLFLLPEVAHNIWPIAGLVIGGLLLRQYVQTASTAEDQPRRPGWFWLAVSLSVLLPMLISKKQYTHYALPVYPYIALGLAYWLGFLIGPLLERFRHWYRYGWVGLLPGVLLWSITLWYGWTRAGTLSYDRPLHEDIHHIGQWVPGRSVVGVFPDVMRNFPLHPYLQRYYRIDMMPIKQHPTFALIDKAVERWQLDSLVAQGYRPLHVNMHQFSLYRR